jgi:peptidoglycan/xylan/chitin deacetylase (PgdA/CDA1 family)
MQGSYFIKEIVLRGLTLFAPKKGSWASILMYHSVGENSALFTVPVTAFEKQLQYLVKQNYIVISLSELVSRIKNKKSLKKVVVLTFDDGYADNYEIVFPLLKKYNFSASIFVTTGMIGTISKDRTGAHLPMLSVEQIKEMKQSELVEFLPHGELHKKLHNASRDEAQKEITNSRIRLQAMLGEVPAIFAYPSGKYSEETLHILAEEGYFAACTVRPGLVRQGTPLLELPRNHIDSKTQFSEFRARLTAAGEWYEKLKMN